MRPQNRAERRRLARIKKRRTKERLLAENRGALFSFPVTDDYVGKLARTPTPCSCEMCGNRRRYDKPKGLTLQERRQNEAISVRHQK